jgi:hypothetical protein
VRDQVGERVGDADEQRVEALLGQQLVEDIRQALVRLDELGRGRARLRQQPEVGLGSDDLVRLVVGLVPQRCSFGGSSIGSRPPAGLVSPARGSSANAGAG